VDAIETIFWSAAFPGFGQILNGKLIKGFIFIGLEVLINVQGNFNSAIIYSFQGEIQKAIQVTNHQWLMFYPCLYFFSMWDAYRDAGGGKKPWSSLPFVFSAYFVTLGLFYSSKLNIFGMLLGPVWLPMLFLIPGILSGFIIRRIVLYFK
jgi:hypothetical protein